MSLELETELEQIKKILPTHDIKLFSGRSNNALAQEIAQYLGTTLEPITIKDFSPLLSGFIAITSALISDTEIWGILMTTSWPTLISDALEESTTQTVFHLSPMITLPTYLSVAAGSKLLILSKSETESEDKSS